MVALEWGGAVLRVRSVLSLDFLIKQEAELLICVLVHDCSDTRVMRVRQSERVRGLGEEGMLQRNRTGLEDLLSFATSADLDHRAEVPALTDDLSVGMAHNSRLGQIRSVVTKSPIGR